MSRDPKAPANGAITEKGYTALFDLARVAVVPDKTSKPIICKLSINTDVWAMVTDVRRSLPHLSAAKVTRLLIKVGYSAFVKSERARGNVE